MSSSYEQTENGLEVSVIDSLPFISKQEEEDVQVIDSTISGTTTPLMKKAGLGRKTVITPCRLSNSSSPSATTISTVMTDFDSNTVYSSRRRSSSISSFATTPSREDTSQYAVQVEPTQTTPVSVPPLPSPSSSPSLSSSSNIKEGNLFPKSSITYSLSDVGGISSSSDGSSYQSHSRSCSYDLEYSDEDLSIADSVDANNNNIEANDSFVSYDDGNVQGTTDMTNDQHDNVHKKHQQQQQQQQLKIKKNVDGTMSNHFDLGPLKFDTSSSDYPSIRTLDLVIDELPSRNHPKKNPGIQPFSNDGSKHFLPIPKLNEDKQSTSLSSFTTSWTSSFKPTFQHGQSNTTSTSPNKSGTNTVLTSFVDSFWPVSNHSDSNKDDQECSTNSQIKHTNTRNQRIPSPPLSSPSTTVKSLGYTIKNCIVEGWLNKKGTGKDLFQSTSWKPRWCSLVTASIPGYDYDVPLLLVSWQFSVKPSNVIILDSSVAVKVDPIKRKDTLSSNNANDNHDNNCIHCFDIVSTKESNTKQNNFYNTNNTKSQSSSSSSSSSSCSSSNLTTTSTLFNGKLARSFSASTRKDRDTWVQIINETIECYEKSKRTTTTSLRRLNTLSISNSNNGEDRLALPPTSPLRKSRSRANGDRFDLSGLSIAC